MEKAAMPPGPDPEGEAGRPRSQRPPLRRVLVGWDWTDSGNSMIDSLPALQAWGVEELVISHVVRSSPAPLIHATDGTRGVGEKLSQANALLARQFQVELSMLKGDVVSGLVKEADDRRADAIVLGVGRRSRLQEALVGSTVADIIRRTDLPVLLIPLPEDGDGHLHTLPPPAATRILHPTDFSEPAIRALLLARGLARENGLPVTLLHVTEGTGEHRDREAQRRLSNLAASLRERGVERVETEVARGVPWMRILENAGKHGSTLIVMGSRGHRGLPGILLGSQSREVACQSDFPLLLAPPRRPGGWLRRPGTRAFARDGRRKATEKWPRGGRERG